MLTETRDAVDGYWADALGCSRAVLRQEGLSVVEGPADEVELVARGDSVVVAVGSSRTNVVRDALAGLSATAAVDADVLTARFASIGIPVNEVLGPAYLGYADDSTLWPVDASTRPTVEDTVRTLTESDSGAYDRFRAACSDDEWDAGGSDLVPERTVGRFVDGNLVALAGYTVWDDTLAHIAVVTHPDHRNEGHAQAVVGRVARVALDDGLVPQYRTLDAWPWSIQAATNVGFERWGTSLLVRFD
ncbi:hypothetical protein SAMN04487950_2511 [Halogranum rubrum]|uniref:N-acetyltransferase domain-containing protein n=1 Tax=Halogranum rubrum TaxID=553466 RepID=A0A1I4F0R7_9EURY|nr:GNAT family N-acetyltransferase [Halogranum rubrum]SFL11033.1 hypothetical protein SAMN04487950_2511 [Halogranum rubrum]